MSKHLADRLEAAAVPNDTLWAVANQMVHVADAIANAADAPYRPRWADPAATARTLFAEQGSLLRLAARQIRNLESQLMQSAEVRS